MALLTAVTAIAAFAVVSTDARAANGGGGSIPDGSSIKDVRCESLCAAIRSATVGSTVRFYGNGLQTTTKVRFPKKGGGYIHVNADSAGNTSVTATVPADAATGIPRPKSVGGTLATVKDGTKKLKIVAPGVLPSDGPFQIEAANTSSLALYAFGSTKAKLNYTFSGTDITDVRVQVVKEGNNNSVVREWIKKGQNAYVNNKVTWDGSLEDGRAAKPGKYRFRIAPLSSNSAPAVVGGTIKLNDHAFPLRSKFYFGDGYGSGRGHQGVDLLTPCGKPIRAARAGKVVWRKYQAGGAGHYLVIRGKGIKRDYVYMHMKKKSKLKVGRKVKTGQVIGKVGTTGRSSACHLHLEVWKGQWYGGGKPMSNVKKQAKRWQKKDPLAGKVQAGDRIPVLGSFTDGLLPPVDGQAIPTR